MSTAPRAIEVFRQIPGGDNRWVGVGLYLLPRPQKPGVFVYHEDYDGPPLAASLDYRMGQREFVHAAQGNPNLRGPHADDLHPVFAQALPGQWGELVLASQSAAYARATPAEKLYMLGDWQSGGLRFNASDIDIDHYVETFDALRALQRRVDEFISRYASEKVCPFAMGRDKYKWALANHGGAQPKAAYIDDMGECYVAKFPRDILGTYQEARVEASLCEVSRRAGLNTAETVLVSNADNSSILLSRRFDVDDRSTILHTVSAAAAIENPKNDYSDLVAFARQHSADPDRDVEEIFGRMVLNRAVNNTDDHLGQWVFIQDERGDWSLSPNIDIMVTDLDLSGRPSPHQLAMLGDNEPPLTASWIVRSASSFGIEEARASEIAQRVLSAVLEFPQIARENGVDPQSLAESLEPAMALAAAERALRSLRDAEAARSASPGV